MTDTALVNHRAHMAKRVARAGADLAALAAFARHVYLRGAAVAWRGGEASARRPRAAERLVSHRVVVWLW